MIYYVYILACGNESLYTGYTTDIKRRYQEHLNGTHKSKYTRSFPPKSILSCWAIEGTLSEALKFEAAIKKLNKKQKLRLGLMRDEFLKFVIKNKLNISTIKQIIA